MDPEKLKAAIEALKSNDGEAALAVLEQLLTELAGGSAPDPVEGEALAEGVEDEPEDPTKPKDEELGTEILSALRALAPGSKTAAEAIVALGARVSRLDADREAVELEERRGHIATLIKLGYETPALAWEGDPKVRKPVKRLASEPIADLRSRVEILSKTPRATVERPSVVAGSTRVLSAKVKAQIKKLGMTEAEYHERHAAAVTTRA